jgi:hypothetical protein
MVEGREAIEVLRVEGGVVVFEPRFNRDAGDAVCCAAAAASVVSFVTGAQSETVLSEYR